MIEKLKQIDNINLRLADELKAGIQKKSRLAIAASSFSIYAYEALRKESEDIDELRFIFTSPTFLRENFKKRFPTLIQQTDYPDSKAYLDYFNQIIHGIWKDDKFNEREE